MKKMTDPYEEGCAPHDAREAFRMITGKWKLEILWLLWQRVHRFGELKRAIPDITQHMLTAQLRKLGRKNTLFMPSAFLIESFRKIFDQFLYRQGLT